MSASPRILRASFSDGVRWLTQGADLLGRDGSLMLRVAAWLVVITLIQMVPVIGVPLLVLISPALTGGMLGLFRRVDAGQPARPEQVFDGLRNPVVRTRLLVLGGFLLIGVFAAVMAVFAWLSPQMDMEALNALMGDPQAMESDPDRLFALFEGVNLFGGFALGAVVMGLVLGALYFGVPLVFFWNWPVIAALLWISPLAAPADATYACHDNRRNKSRQKCFSRNGARAALGFPRIKSGAGSAMLGAGGVR
jgi:hypothetical protein